MSPIIIIARLFLPLIILRYPLFGGAVAIILDNIDWHTRSLFGLRPFFDYQSIDKILDMYYLSLIAIVGWKFKNILIRNLIFGLFIYRFIGFLLFEFTQMRSMLFLFPNIYENFFFFYYILKTIASYEPKIPIPTTVLFVVLVAVPKILQEYAIHIIQKPLEFNIFGFLYIYEGSNHQIAYILFISVFFGLLYKKSKKANVPS